MSTVPEAELQRAVRDLHGCDATFVESVPVVVRNQVATVWDGVVAVFALDGHPTAKRAYAWSEPVPESDRRRVVAVLRLPPVASAADAVRSSIVADRPAAPARRKPKRGRWRRRKFLDDHPGADPPLFF